MSQGLIIFLVIYGLISIITLVAFSATASDSPDVIYKSPKEIYNNIRVNWFGAVSIFILLSIVCPLGYLFYVVPKILFTVGRE